MPEPVTQTFPLPGVVTVMPGGFISRADAARILGVSVSSLCLWAQRGIGPTSTKASTHLHIYKLAEVPGEAVEARSADQAAETRRRQRGRAA